MEMVLRQVSETISVGFMDLSLGLGAPVDWCYLAFNLKLDISGVHVPVGLCFGYDAP